MSVKLNESVSIIAGAVLVGIVLFNLDYSFLRRKTFFEKNYLKCLTGVATEDKNLFKRTFGIRSIYIKWGDAFPWKRAVKIAKRGSLLMLTWEPYLKREKEKSILPDIVSGKYDNLISKFAMSAKNFGKPILLRWAQEPNGDWYSWSGAYNKDSLYIKAHRRIYEIFMQKNCHNVKFVFCVNYDDIPGKRWNKFENYYPGSDYVDVVAMDVYNWGDTRGWSKWTHFPKIIKKPYERMIKLAPDKPIILGEIASCYSGGDKARWMEEFMKNLKTKFTAVKAFVWFDWDKECNWKITDRQNVFDVYKKQVSGDFFSNNPKDFYEVFGFSS